MSIQSNINQIMNTLALSTFGIKKGLEEHKAEKASTSPVQEMKVQEVKNSMAQQQTTMRQEEIKNQRQATIDNLLRARQNIENYERSEK